MSDLPPNEDQSDDELEQLYRRASSRDASRPSDSVRNAVLRHAADLAQDRAASNRPTKQSWRRPVTYGGLAAAALAGLLIAPHFLPPPVATLSAARTAPVSAPASLAQPAPVPDVRAMQSEDVAAQAPSREAAAKYRRPTADDRAADASGAATGQAQAPSAPRTQYRARESLKAQVDEPQNAQTATAAASAPPRPTDSAAALRQAAALGQVAQLNTLLGAQPDINARDAAGRTALMVAVLNGQTSAVEALLASGADANARDAHGTTPLQAALAINQQAIAASLRRAGAR